MLTKQLFTDPYLPPEVFVPPEAGTDPLQVTTRAERAVGLIKVEREKHLDKADRYLRGDHDKPYYPVSATRETKELATKAITNWMPLIVGVPAQVSFVEGMRRDKDDNPAEFKVWDENRMSSRQTRIYRSALTFGHSFVALDLSNGPSKIKLRSLSPLSTIALYDDPGSDMFPIWALTVLEMPAGKDVPGRAMYWDDEIQCELHYRSDGTFTIIDETAIEHKLGDCPVGRFTTELDLEGRARGLVEQMIPLQDRINQTVFDLLIAQTYGAFNQRYAAGLVGDPIFDDEGNPVLDEDGEQMTRPLEMDPSRIWASDDPDTKFGTLEGTPLGGFIEALEIAVQHLAAISQIPPHALLGTMANLSAEALAAAEAQLMRMVDALHFSWGETWASLFQLVARAQKITEGDAYTAQIRWRDMSAKTMAGTMDALGKAAQMLEIPKRGLWSRFPGATDSDIERWNDMAKEDADNAAEMDPQQLYVRSINKAKVTPQPAAQPAPVPTPRDVQESVNVNG